MCPCVLVHVCLLVCSWVCALSEHGWLCARCVWLLDGAVFPLEVGEDLSLHVQGCSLGAEGRGPPDAGLGGLGAGFPAAWSACCLCRLSTVTAGTVPGRAGRSLLGGVVVEVPCPSRAPSCPVLLLVSPYQAHPPSLQARSSSLTAVQVGHCGKPQDHLRAVLQVEGWAHHLGLRSDCWTCGNLGRSRNPVRLWPSSRIPRGGVSPQSLPAAHHAAPGPQSREAATASSARLCGCVVLGWTQHALPLSYVPRPLSVAMLSWGGTQCALPLSYFPRPCYFLF